METQATNLFEKRVQQSFPHIPILLQPKATKKYIHDIKSSQISKISKIKTVLK